MTFSFIIPVYNRPDELRELLTSLAQQPHKDDFEVIVVDDGSQKPCQDVCNAFAHELTLQYHYKDNSGPGQSRNYGAQHAHGQWFVVLDSDVVLPPGYVDAIRQGVADGGCDAWGGPDTAHPDFTTTQKAISYAMTSFFTTGGIRGGKGVKLDKFFPRSFNMGVRAELWQRLGGFSNMRFGEDIDFSYRIVEAGGRTRLISDAWVWHKRRTDMKKFFRQVFNSGIARINLEKRHPGTLKPVHALPAVFTIGVAFLLTLFFIGHLVALAINFPIGLLICFLALQPLLAYAIIVGIDSTVKNSDINVGLLSVPAAFTQLIGYGLGFISAWWQRSVMGKDEYHAFDKTFYK